MFLSGNAVFLSGNAVFLSGIAVFLSGTAVFLPGIAMFLSGIAVVLLFFVRDSCVSVVFVRDYCVFVRDCCVCCQGYCYVCCHGLLCIFSSGSTVTQDILHPIYLTTGIFLFYVCIVFSVCIASCGPVPVPTVKLVKTNTVTAC